MAKKINKNERLYVEILDGRKVTLELFSFVVAQLAMHVPDLERGKGYTADGLLGNALRDCLPPEDHSDAKYCLMDIVWKRLFPIGFTREKNRYLFAPEGIAADTDAVIRAYLASAIH